jgi:hypothetical protein
MQDNVQNINRAVFQIFENVKDSVKAALASSMISGAIKVENASAEKLLSIATAAIDEAFNRVHPHFEKTLKANIK